ncbi:uncharacterized protein [Porites lutea]|uniref:uncharacterized protein n=1 Tax=Porites lutea TaxID=51062 RepID=UPI003CC66B06
MCHSIVLHVLVAHLKVFSQQGFKGAVFPIFRGENIIGRSETCNITILNETLSKKHACISVNAERNLHLIHDCQSTNGTKKGKSLLVPILRYELKHGDMLTFGILECQYLVGGDVDMFKSEEDETVSESDSDSVLPDVTVDLNVKKDRASEAGSGTESELANQDEDTREELETNMDLRSEAGSETESESVLLPLISTRIQHKVVLLVVLTVFAIGF